MIKTRFGRIRILLFLAQTTLFCRAGLVIDENSGAFDLPEFALQRIHFITMVKRNRRRKQAFILVFFRLVANHRDASGALGINLVSDSRHAEFAIDGLTARHRGRVVIEYFISDIYTRGDRLANRHIAGMEIRALAEILENMAIAQITRLADPADTFPTHLNQRRCLAIHP